MGKALVVDDSRVMRRIVGKILSDLGFEVVEADDGQAALERLVASPPFELAMVDWNMPRMNGLELLQALRGGAAPKPKHVVMVTTETEPSQMARALLAGASEYVMKPFTREVIEAKLALIGVQAASALESGP